MLALLSQDLQSTSSPAWASGCSLSISMMPNIGVGKATQSLLLIGPGVLSPSPCSWGSFNRAALIQVENGAEYILETIDSLQKHSWVADIQGCVDPG